MHIANSVMPMLLMQNQNIAMQGLCKNFWKRTAAMGGLNKLV